MTPDGFDLVVRHLWMGSAPPPGSGLRQHGIDTLVLCAIEYQPPKSAFDVNVIRCPLNDNGSPMTIEEAISAVETAKKVRAIMDRGKGVLVTCAQGRNRSGLVTALALMAEGIGGEEAIRLVRRARGPSALSNRYFTNLILKKG